MNILYHLATLRPKMPQAEAISQEIAALRGCFGGDVVYVNPNQQFPLYIPRLLFGFHKLKELRSREANLHIHHFYNPDPFPFPYLRTLRRPVIYSVTCGVGDRRPNVAFFSSLAAVAVSDERSLKWFKSWGMENTVLVRPGIDTSRFTCSPLPLRSGIRLMVGSAPWTKGQFRAKGVEALLLAARQAPHLRLVFLWRGVLADEMERRVRRMNLAEQITVLNELVDVNEVLAGVHASITLATAPGIVKSYPHSLLESLAAGKPVLVSRAIPMADYVEQTSCGKVVDRVTPTDILTAVEALAREYENLQKVAQRVGQRDFSQQKMIISYRRVYEHVLGSTGRS
ncbi:MAG TPA: glycosyltransferase [Anaerolineae bacterium]|nr:glycosyltransferase [Anaerolineae bacterium]